MTQEIESIRVPVFDKKSPGEKKVEAYPIVFPHRILSYLFDDVGLDIPESVVNSYWDHSIRMKEPWACESEASRFHMPVGIHGDAARLWTVYKVEKLVGVWMNLPLFRPKSVRHSRWLLFSIPRDKLIKNRTLNAVWKRLVWSLNAAFEGKNPEHGPGGCSLFGDHLARAGTPLCKTNRRFALTELRGDWEWHRDTWRFTASWNGQQVCFKCPALKSGDERYRYYNISDSSRWLGEEFTLDQFIARRLKENQL